MNKLAMFVWCFMSVLACKSRSTETANTLSTSEIESSNGNNAITFPLTCQLVNQPKNPIFLTLYIDTNKSGERGFRMRVTNVKTNGDDPIYFTSEFLEIPDESSVTTKDGWRFFSDYLEQTKNFKPDVVLSLNTATTEPYSGLLFIKQGSIYHPQLDNVDVKCNSSK